MQVTEDEKVETYERISNFVNLWMQDAIQAS